MPKFCGARFGGGHFAGDSGAAIRGALAFAVAALSAYLMLANLDSVALWHDEATNALMAAALARDGTLSGWDGRNLFFGTTFVGQNKYAIDDDLRMSFYPPWPAIPSALGILLFGGGEFALRFPHALLGALCLPAFWLVLSLNFPARPRLRLFAFALFALSPIVILYMRQGRYYPDAILFSLLSLYCYQRFWRDDRGGWLAAAAFFTALNFLNHFTAAVSFAVALALWHVIFFRRETSRRQWLAFAAAGGITAAACGGYLYAAGILGGDAAVEYGEDVYKHSRPARSAWLSYVYMRDIVRFGWLPLWIALWWAAYSFRRNISLPRRRKRRSAADIAARKEQTETERQARRWGVLALLIIATTAAVSVTPPEAHGVLADMRYMIPALPPLMFMAAFCVDRIWIKNKIAGGTLLAVLLCSNFAGVPFLVQGALCGEDERHFAASYFVAERFPLFALIREIHRDTPTGTAEAAAYLREHAAQDDTVLVGRPADSAVLLHYLGDKLIFCCALPEDAALPEDKIRALGAPTYRGDAKPKWFVEMNNAPPPRGYEEVFVGEAVSYPVHRPELEIRCFGESRLPLRARIYRRSDS